MGSFTDYLENEILDHLFENGAYTPTSTVEVALWVGDPTDTGAGGTEAAYTNYARQTIAFDAASSRLINQTSQIDFPQSGATGETGITHYAIFEASAGNMLAHGSLSASVDVVEGNTPSIAAGQIDISFGTNNMSDYLANKILDFVFRNQALSAPTISLAFTTSTLAVTDTTLSGKEVANSNNYSRKTFADWTTASGGALSNNTDIVFATPSGSWGTIVAVAVMDSATHSSGNMLWFDNGITDQAVGNGDTVKFNAGDFDVALS
jgi:hypothetical protein